MRFVTMDLMIQKDVATTKLADLNCVAFSDLADS